MMRNIRTFLCLLFALALPIVAQAQSSVQIKPLWKVFTVGDVQGASMDLLNDVSCTGAPATRTLVVYLSGKFSKLRLPMFLTYVQADAISSTAECSYDGTKYANYLTRSCTSGACTGYVMVDTLATGEAAIDGAWEYDVSGCLSFRTVVACTNAAAGDLLDVQAIGFY